VLHAADGGTRPSMLTAHSMMGLGGVVAAAVHTGRHSRHW
jgi:hypothetical protein